MPDSVECQQANVFAHDQHDKRNSRRRRNPHWTDEIGQLVARLIRREQGLQRHPADLARPRCVADDLGVHRAGLLRGINYAPTDGGPIDLD